MSLSRAQCVSGTKLLAVIDVNAYPMKQSPIKGDSSPSQRLHCVYLGWDLGIRKELSSTVNASDC